MEFLKIPQWLIAQLRTFSSGDVTFRIIPNKMIVLYQISKKVNYITNGLELENGSEKHLPLKYYENLFVGYWNTHTVSSIKSYSRSMIFLFLSLSGITFLM